MMDWSIIYAMKRKTPDSVCGAAQDKIKFKVAPLPEDPAVCVTRLPPELPIGSIPGHFVRSWAGPPWRSPWTTSTPATRRSWLHSPLLVEICLRRFQLVTILYWAARDIG